MRLALTVVDTPGYGDAVDNTSVSFHKIQVHSFRLTLISVSPSSPLPSGCWEPILAYIDQQFDSYLEGETRVERVEVGSFLGLNTWVFLLPPHGILTLRWLTPSSTPASTSSPPPATASSPSTSTS